MSPFSLCLASKTFTLIWYLEPLISSNKSLNNFLILGILASYWSKGSFESIISVPAYFLAYFLNAFNIFLYLIHHKIEVHVVNICF